MDNQNLTIQQIMRREKLEGKSKYPISKYDKNGNEIYFENSKGYWWKKEKGKELEFNDGKYYLNNKLLKKGGD